MDDQEHGTSADADAHARRLVDDVLDDLADEHGTDWLASLWSITVPAHEVPAAVEVLRAKGNVARPAVVTPVPPVPRLRSIPSGGAA